MSSADRRARVAIVYHSRGGHTRALAQSVAEGASSVGGEVVLVDVGAQTQEGSLLAAQDWLALANADAIIFGSPTFMGSVSAPFKAFMDATFDAWIVQGFRDKLAAGFTNSSAASGDKLNTLIQLAVFAAQHGMIWVGLGLHPSLHPSEGGGRASGQDVNRLGSHLGAMAQSNIGEGPETAPPPGDRQTGFLLGKRVTLAARRWIAGDAEPDATVRHPTARTWSFPPERPPLAGGMRRTNLRALMARPGRFEHHLTVVAKIAHAQLEVVTASEPLAFAHVNHSDEYAIALPTGDALLDGFPLRTFLSDAKTGEDVGRLQHRSGDLVLHPFGFSHWPGRLRPPYEPYPFGPGMRRTGISLVFCACADVPPAERPLFVTEGRETDVKSYVADAPPFLLCETGRHPATQVASIPTSGGAVTMTLLVEPETIAPSRGGYVLVLSAHGDVHWPTDLVFVPEGASLDADGIERALVVASASERAEPPPASWDHVPEPPIAPFEEGARGALPISIGAMTFAEATSGAVAVRLRDAEARVPRHWLARMLFRIALHRGQLGYIETYGGLYADDRGGQRLGIRGAGDVSVDPAQLEALYRAVAPDGYRERLD